jgi:hypothetical protein
MFFIRRSFSKLEEFIKSNGKVKLPALDKQDKERNVTDVEGLFQYVLETARPSPINPLKPLLPRTELNKMALL